MCGALSWSCGTVTEHLGSVLVSLLACCFLYVPGIDEYGHHHMASTAY